MRKMYYIVQKITTKNTWEKPFGFEILLGFINIYYPNDTFLSAIIYS